MTLIEQIQTEAPSQRVSGIRVLIAFGNPLGNAVGETAIATQHYRFLRAIFHDMTCTVWTSSGGLWRALSGTSDIECVPTISAERLATGFDLMFFDWIALGPDLLHLLECSSASLLWWPFRRANLQYRLRGRGWDTLALPPMFNFPGRIAECYRALGVKAPIPAPLHSRNSQGHLYLNPFASSENKCLQPELVARLLAVLKPHTDNDPHLVVPGSPGHAVYEEHGVFSRLAQLVRSHSQVRGVHVHASLSIDQYIDCIRTAALVIGPDTSSQHIAAQLDIPSITCYPGSSRFNFYFWGPTAVNSIALNQPLQDGGEECDGLVELIGVLARHFWDRPNVVRRRHIDVTTLRDNLDRFIHACRDRLTNDVDAAKAYACATAALERIALAIPTSWHVFMLPELHQITDELFEIKAPLSSDVTAAAAARLQTMNISKITTLLESGPS